MSIQLTQQEFNQLASILAGVPEFRLARDRVDFVDGIFHSSPRRDDILGQLSLDGGARAVAGRLINRLIWFGQDVPGRETLGLLIDALFSYLGEGEKTAFLHSLHDRYPLRGRTEATPPAESTAPEYDAAAPITLTQSRAAVAEKIRRQLTGGRILLQKKRPSTKADFLEQARAWHDWRQMSEQVLRESFAPPKPLLWLTEIKPTHQDTSQPLEVRITALRQDIQQDIDFLEHRLTLLDNYPEPPTVAAGAPEDSGRRDDPRVERLRATLSDRKTVLFLGGDLPASVTNLPSRADLARGLCQRYGLEDTPSLARAAQQVSRAGHRYEFTAYLREQLDTTGKPIPLFYRRVADLVATHQIETIITTAYDDWLESALKAVGVTVNRVVRSSDVAFINPERPTLIRLYGEVNQPETLIVTEDDQYGLTRNRDKETVLDEIRSALRRNAVLFLGYNLSDPDFNLLWREVLASMGQFPIGATAVWSGLSEAEQRIWSERHIEVIDADPVALVSFLTPTSADPAAPVRKSDASAEPPAPEPLYGSGQRWAVIVGVNQYDDKQHFGRLQVCVKDAVAVRDQLLAGGYEPARVRLLTDDSEEPPVRAKIAVTLQAVAEATEPDDVLLFFYSGHGDADGEDSYLVARDGYHLALQDSALSIARVKAIMESAPARAKVIVIDACHSGADIQSKGPQPMSAAFIRRVFDEAEGLAILASCKQKQLSYEWRQAERSVFTHYLLEALAGAADRDDKGFVTVQDASRHVSNGVKLWASQRNISQTPTLQVAMAGDIILVRLTSEEVGNG